MSKKSFDLYEEVTKRVIAQLEQGVIPWNKPWTGSNGAWSRATGKNYSFLNQLMLESGEYATFKEIKEHYDKLGMELPDLKGKSRQVVYWKWLDIEADGENGDKVQKKIPFLRYYNVFNVAEVGMLPKYTKVSTLGFSESVQVQAVMDCIAENYLHNSGVQIRENDGQRACYSPLTDTVEVPKRECFSKMAEYYSTLFHELAHSTGHSSRLNRGLEELAGFGSESYSREELVAELTSSAILANKGVETESSFRNNAAYIQSWLKALKNDKKMLVWASGRAEKAYNLILGIVDTRGAEA